MRRSLSHLLLCLAVVVGGIAPASAQVTDVPPFEVGGSSFHPPDVAVGPDNTMVFVWSESSAGVRQARSRHYSPAGTPLGPARLLDLMDDVRETAISARPDGTMLAVWHRRNDGSAVYGRRLDGTGAPLGLTFSLTSNDRLVHLMSVVDSSAGSLVLWRQSDLLARFFDPTGVARGPEFTLDQFGFYSDGAVLPDGGFVTVANSYARFYDGDGTPRGPAIWIGSEFRPERVASNPNGDIAIVGNRTTSGVSPRGIWLRRMNAAGDVFGNLVLVHPTYTTEEHWAPDVEVDVAGNALVVWSGTDGGDVSTQQVRGRAFDVSNTPIAHPFVVADEFAADVRVARMADGRFVTVWNPSGAVTAKVLSLCLPGVAQCGDGIRHEECEQCDDGLANSDTAPDACRTDCSLPRCSDGTVDSAEQCDDGNLTSCDGCSDRCVAEPGVVCGDGLPEITCHQPCDDTNTIVGDGCTAECRIEPIPGGGSRVDDCRSVWVVDNPGNDPLTDKYGLFRVQHRCLDNDPQCDFDGGTSGGCTFHVRVCANASGMTDCVGGIRIASWSLDRPSAKQAATSPVLAAVRASFAPVPGVVLGPTISDVCTDWLPVIVPLRGEPGAYRHGKLVVKSRATPYEGKDDKDTLKLACLAPE